MDRVSFPFTLLPYQTDLLSVLQSCLVLSAASTLDAFRSYQQARSCPATAFRQPVDQRRQSLVPLVLEGPYSQATDNFKRYYRPVSRRTEPSSCRFLMDEQPNLWRLMHRQDNLSRQRCTKPRGRWELSPATSLLPPE